MRITLVILMLLSTAVASAQIDVLQAKADKCNEEKDYKCAIKYSKLLLKEKGVNRHVVLSNIGGAYYELQDYDNALVYFTQSLQSLPDYIVGRKNRALVFEKLKDYKSAILDYDTCIYLNPTIASFYFSRAELYRKLGNLDSTKVDLIRVLEIDKDHYGANVNLALVKKRQGDYLGAADDFKRLIAKFPGKGIIYNNLADTEMLLGQLDSALQHINEGIAIDPDYINGFITKGEILLKLGRNAEACELFRYAFTKGDEDDKANANKYLGDCR
jgi:tetratricopeptide (TPR) repeat protein